MMVTSRPIPAPRFVWIAMPYLSFSHTVLGVVTPGIDPEPLAPRPDPSRAQAHAIAPDVLAGVA